MTLKNKNVLIGVTASISIYKTLDLIRELVRAEANVRVVMTPSAKKFISPITFEAISNNIVLDETTENWHSDNNHIGITKWLDVYLIAPCSANTLNKLSNAFADNLVTQTALACTKQIIIAPAANTNMLAHPLSDASLRMLKVNGYHIIPPIEKTLVCGDTGSGALADISDIYYIVSKYLLQDDFWLNRKVIITGGGTKEAIDDVRYISNNSSGKMANALAHTLYMRGADVCLIRTDELQVTSNIHTIDVDTSKEMEETLKNAIEYSKKPTIIDPTLKNKLSSKQIVHKKPFLFMAAAVSDYILPKTDGKLKKSENNTLNLVLEKNIDILGSLEKSNIYTIGFKAELDANIALKNAKDMLVHKSLDAVCLNVINEDNNFGSDQNKIDFVTKDGVKEIPLQTKKEIAFDISEVVKKLEVL